MDKNTMATILGTTGILSALTIVITGMFLGINGMLQLSGMAGVIGIGGAAVGYKVGVKL